MITYAYVINFLKNSLKIRGVQPLVNYLPQIQGGCAPPTPPPPYFGAPDMLRHNDGHNAETLHTGHNVETQQSA